MNMEQVKGVVERVLTAAFMYAAGRGWIPQDSVGAFVTVGGVLLSAGWGVWVNTHGSLSTAAQKVS